MRSSFILVELLTIIGISILLTALAIPAFHFFETESDLNNSAEEIINALRLAQSKTLASEGASQWGVYFNTTTDPYQYVLFKGVDYALRDNSLDLIYKLPMAVEVYGINLSGGREVVFNRTTGQTSQSGNVSLRLKSNPTKTRTVYVDSSGQIGSIAPLTPSDANRIKDSRHIHFNYQNRLIDTASEKLTLTFEGAVTKDIIISENLKDGQIYWEGEVDVSGQVQKLKIHTHKLNTPDTQFCIHRDKRYNTKTLKIEISGDTSGDLIRYDANGQTTKGTSIYVSAPIWQ